MKNKTSFLLFKTTSFLNPKKDDLKIQIKTHLYTTLIVIRKVGYKMMRSPDF